MPDLSTYKKLKEAELSGGGNYTDSQMNQVHNFLNNLQTSPYDAVSNPDAQKNVEDALNNFLVQKGWQLPTSATGNSGGIPSLGSSDAINQKALGMVKESKTPNPYALPQGVSEEDAEAQAKEFNEPTSSPSKPSILPTPPSSLSSPTQASPRFKNLLKDTPPTVTPGEFVQSNDKVTSEDISGGDNYSDAKKKALADLDRKLNGG